MSSLPDSPDARTLLKDSGLRATPTRVAVLCVLHEAGRPLSHANIAEVPGMEEQDRVTLYRTLTALQEVGLVHRVQGKDGVWHYCAHLPSREGCQGNHPHFLCIRCAGMQCLTVQSLPWIEVPGEMQVIGKQLVVYGLCPECRAREERNRTSSQATSPTGTAPDRSAGRSG